MTIQIPPAVTQKLRRSSSSDAHASATTRKGLQLPRRASVSFVGRSYADALRGAATAATAIKLGEEHHEAVLFEAEDEHLEAEFPAPSPASSPISKRTTRADREEALHHYGQANAFARAQMKGKLLGSETSTTLKYCGLMSAVEWNEAYFMKTGNRRGKLYKEASLAFQML